MEGDQPLASGVSPARQTSERTQSPMALSQSFESPFLGDMEGEDDLFAEEEGTDDEEAAVMAQHLKMQQRMQQAQEQMEEHQYERQAAEAIEQQAIHEQRFRELEKERIVQAAEGSFGVFDGEEPYVPTAAEEEAIRSGKAPNKRALLKQMQAQRQAFQEEYIQSLMAEPEPPLQDMSTEEVEEHMMRLRQHNAEYYASAQLAQQRNLKAAKLPPNRCTRSEPSSSPTSGKLTPIKKRPASRSGALRPPADAAKQGERIREAKNGLRTAEEDVLYWRNRVNMLKQEMDKTIHKIEQARRVNDVIEVSKLLNERTQQALDEQKQSEDNLLEAKRAANRQRSQEQREAIWQARLCHYEENAGMREQVKLEQENNARIIGHIRYEELQDNVKRKEEIQQQKIVALLKRVQDRADKEQEAHRRFEERITKTKEKEGQKQQEAMLMIKESAVLMQHLKALKDEHNSVLMRVDPKLSLM